MVALQNHSWKISISKSGKPRCLHRNCVKFCLPHSIGPASVVLIDSTSYLEVHVLATDPDPSLYSDICPQVYKAVINGLNRSASPLRYKCFKPEVAFLCLKSGPSCSDEPHLASIGGGHGRWTCSINEEVGGKLTDKHKPWLLPVTTPGAYRLRGEGFRLKVYSFSLVG